MLKYSILTSAIISITMAGQMELSNKDVFIDGPTGNGNLTFKFGKFLYWNSTKSTLNWNLQAKGPGELKVNLVQSNNTPETSKLLLSFSDNLLHGKVKNTKSWTTFEKVDMGTIKFSKGDHTLTFRALDKPGVSVMDLQKIILTGDTELLTLKKPPKNSFAAKPGRLQKVTQPHPALSVIDLSPQDFPLKVNGLDFLSDGTLVIGAWEANGSVYLIKNYDEPTRRRIKRFAWGLHEPLGLKVVDDQIYVVQKQELTRLEDTDGDGVCDFYRNICNAWDVSSNFHEFAFGPIYINKKFYLALAVAVDPGGATTNPQVKDRGCLIEIDPKTGLYQVIAAGLRTPNGMLLTSDSQLFIADNQGDYLPASKVVQIRKGGFYNHKYTPLHEWAKKEVTQPICWLPQSEIANSPTDMLEIKQGFYKGDILIGDICNGGLRRLAVEKVNGELQGTVFHFSQEMRGGTNRIIHDSKGNIVLGINGARGNWGTGKQDGLLKLSWNNNIPFEMRRIRTLSNGIEIEFTHPLKEHFGWDPKFYKLSTWTYTPTIQYGGPKVDEKPLKVISASVSSNRKKVFLELEEMTQNYIVQVLLHDELVSETNQTAYAPQCWLTLNNIPTGKNGNPKPMPADAIILEQELVERNERHLEIYRTQCIACHSTDGTKLVGPSFKSLLGKRQTVLNSKGERKLINIDETYIREAIVNPGSVYPEGYQPIMPNLSNSLTKEEIDALVKWIAGQ